MQTIQELMTPDPVTLPATARIADAAATMAREDIGEVLVVDESSGSLCGMVTDRDIVVRAVAKELDATATPLADIATRDVVSVTLDDRPQDAVSLMRSHSVRRIPVTEDGKVVGVVSIGDLALDLDPDSALADISGAPAND